MRPGTYKVILMAAVGAFIVSSIWYILFGSVGMALRGANAVLPQRSPVATALVELTRNLILVAVLAYLVAGLKVTTGQPAFRLSLLLWLGFPFVLLFGAVFHEGMPWTIAATHGGDWLVKITLIVTILTIGRVGSAGHKPTK